MHIDVIQVYSEKNIQNNIWIGEIRQGKKCEQV